MRMWRLNVKFINLDASVQYSMFALSGKPKMFTGDLLLLQLEKGDAKKEGKLYSRIEYMIVFDHLEEDDVNGSISRKYWPNSDRTWKWIIYGSKTIKTKPFSLEYLLNISKPYGTHYPAIYINKEDEPVILPYICE